MNWTDWASVKDNLLKIYGKTSQFFLFCNLLLYLGCCIVAGAPVGPVGYIAFLYHCCQWRVKAGG
jgi:hypothetical protein